MIRLPSPALLHALVASLVALALSSTSWADAPPPPPARAAPATAAAAPPPTAAPPAPAAATTGKNIADAVPCSACHSTVAWRQSDARGAGGFDHSTTGFPLTGQHQVTACNQCHGGQPVKRACNSCHEDVHRGRLSRSCDECHSAAGWQVTKAIDIHRKTRFPITGMHTLADCSQCHQRSGDHQWTTAPVECFACHGKEYGRTDIRPVHTGTTLTAPFPRDCSQCHRSIAWVPALFKASLVTAAAPAALSGAGEVAPRGHDLRFPISFGPHRTAACSDCHSNLAAPRSVRCVGCHAHDPARLVAQHKGPMATGGASCLSCHLGGARR